MKDYYANTRFIIDKYNQIMDYIKNSPAETSEETDEFLTNFCIYLAHALIKDTGYGQQSRDELNRVADIISDVIM